MVGEEILVRLNSASIEVRKGALKEIAQGQSASPVILEAVKNNLTHSDLTVGLLAFHVLRQKHVSTALEGIPQVLSWISSDLEATRTAAAGLLESLMEEEDSPRKVSRYECSFFNFCLSRKGRRRLS